METKDIISKEFVPYKQALALKELGFEYVSTIFAYNEVGELYTRSGIPHDFNIRGLLSAPTFSQVFRWFREKYNLNSFVIDSKSYNWYFNINDMEKDDVISEVLYFKSYEEAELECLKKLIEIVKRKITWQN